MPLLLSPVLLAVLLVSNVQYKPSWLQDLLTGTQLGSVLLPDFSLLRVRVEATLLQVLVDVEKQPTLLKYRQYATPAHATYTPYTAPHGGLEFS